MFQHCITVLKASCCVGLFISASEVFILFDHQYLCLQKSSVNVKEMSCVFLCISGC